VPKISIGDADIQYEKTGDGPPLMLVPGLGGMGSFWAKQVAELSRHFTVVIHDHRGTGQSTHSRIKYSVDQMAADVVKLMDALKIDRAHFAGHSTGGAIGQTIAQDHPARIASLVLSATWAGRDAYFARAFALRKSILETQGPGPYARASNLMLYPPYWTATHAKEYEVAEAAAAAAPPPTDIALSRIDAIVAFDRRARLGEIKAPTLVIVARDDMVTPLHQSEELAQKIAGARLVVLERGGHFVPVIHPETYNPPVAEFLRKAAGR